MEGHHFGKKSDIQRETHASPPLKVSPSAELPVSLENIPKEVGGFRIPENLKTFLRKLVDPNAIPLVISGIDRGDAEYRRKVEQYVEEISKDIHEKIDARSITESSREEAAASIRDCVDVVVQFKGMNLMARERADVLRIIESDLLGLGPLDELLADDNISDIMVDGPDSVFIEMDGQIDRTNVRFRNELHLLNICQRIVNRVGRHVDKASPICDARLTDGSRVNVILPPLAIKGPALTIRKFKKERLTLDKLVSFGSLDQRTAAFLEIISACRVNMIVTGGTGNGKTTLLNCLTRYISPRERIITCEDAAELQLQQPQVVSLESRPISTEGVGQVTMRDLVRNCLRMRPDRIIVGEVRGAEAFDLLQAMNTGHDGSMGTFHANSPRDAIFRLENMVAMANLSIPVAAVREQMASALEVVVHTQRLRDGSRKIVNISEISGVEGGMITLQDLVSYEVSGVDASGRLVGEFTFSGIYPKFREKARHYGLEADLLEIIDGV